MQTDNLQQRVTELETLNALSHTLISSGKVDDILSAIVDASIRLCRAERAAVLLFNPTDTDEMKTLVRGSDSMTGTIDHALSLQVAGWIESNGKPFLANNIVEGLNLRKAPERWMTLRSALAVPLVVESKTLGILHLLNAKGGAVFNDEGLRLATSIAFMAAQFIHRAKLNDSLFEENRRLKTALQQELGIHRILGSSAAIQQVHENITLAATSANATVLLIGETGTGKELVARSVHLQSARAKAPFIAINCAAIPSALVESELFGHERGAFTGATDARKGKFELANHGTLFLDEIGEMPPDIQPKLLHVLEDRKFYRVGSSVEQKVDVRVVAASSRNLHKAVQEGKFREDLFYRLNVVPISLPPLRERTDDIPVLAQAFLDEFSDRGKRFAKDALDLLQKLEWKGNVRELRNVVERISIFVRSKDVAADDLKRIGIGSVSPDASQLSVLLEGLLRSNTTQTDLVESVEKNFVELAMRLADGKITRRTDAWHRAQRPATTNREVQTSLLIKTLCCY